MKKYYMLASLAIAGVIVLSGASSANAKATQAELFYDDATVGTIANPGRVAPGSGTDPLYMVTNGVEEQLGIASVAPGDDGYHGGRWAVYTVTFSGDPYLLTSDEAVLEAEEADDVIVTRMPELDNRCPVLL